MKTILETITPPKATEYLKRNKINRPLREMTVEQYAVDMKKGHWLTNHQGIAFDTDGNLIDGQHRLSAIVASGVSVKMLVTTSLPICVENGLTVFTMDTVDRGKIRSLGDQLVLRHGIKSGNLVGAVIASLAALVNSGQGTKLTVPMALSILALYRKEIEYVVEGRSNLVGLRSAPPMGAIAFALKSDRDRMEKFYSLLVSGEGLYKTGETSPIFILRKSLPNTLSSHGGQGRWRTLCATLNCAKHYIEGSQLTFLKHTTLGIEYFINRNKSNFSKILDIITL